MSPIRVVVASLPRLLRDIVAAALSAAPEVELVGEAPDAAELPRLIHESGAHVAIVACEGGDVGRLGRLVNAIPVALLAVTDEGRRGVLYELQPREVDLGELHPATLVSAIRALGRSAAAWRT